MALAASCCSSHATMVASVRCSSAHSPSFAVFCSRLVDVALCMRSSLAIVLQQPPAALRMPPMVASVSCSILPHTLSYAGCCSRLVDVAHCMRSSLAIIMAPAASCCSSHATMVASVRCSSAHSPSLAVCCSRLVDVALCMRSSLAIVLACPQWWPRSVAASRRSR